jgi:hypothetical protein
MKLANKNKWGPGYSTKDIDITLKIGTLEDMKIGLGIEFWEIGELVKKDLPKLMINLLYYGYITACKDALASGIVVRPIYTKENAAFWYENLSQSAYKELTEKITILMGEMTKMGSKKKAEQKVS